MDDGKIVELYWDRSEQALEETRTKYGKYCYSIAFNILNSMEDAEESVNDTYHAAWNCMPPHRPNVLATFLGQITRRISIDRWRKSQAVRRGGGEITLALEELGECVEGTGSVEEELERQELIGVINLFLKSLPDTERRVFLCRYWYRDSVSDIAGHFGFSESKITSMLHRIRGKLRCQLEKEGY